MLDRRQLLALAGALLASGTSIGSAGKLLAESMASLEVASAGSIGPMLSGPIKQAISRSLLLNLNNHSQGADAVAKEIVDQSLQADMFIPITAGPMLTVLRAGKAVTARPFAQTELVLLYSPKSRFVSRFEAAARSEANWWEVLQEPGLRLVRSNPAGDPGGRNAVFAMMLAAKRYEQADLVQKVLGPILNPSQILSGGSNRARMQSGEIDAIFSYKVSAVFEDVPYLALPSDINLSGTMVHARNPEIALTLGDKTFYPEPLVFYAAVLKGAINQRGASNFLDWLCGVEGQTLLHRYHFDPVEGIADLHA